MAFTLTHPLAIVPLIKLLKDYTVISALVIGSMVPDLVYYFPWLFPVVDTHQVAALFWFAIPAGILVYLVYHLIATPALLLLLPTRMAGKLDLVSTAGQVPARPWWKVCLSLLAGAATHLAWDAFTHHSYAIPFLNRVLFNIGQSPLRLHDFLQLGTTIAGSLVLVFVLYRWYAKLPARPDREIVYSMRIKWSARAILLLLPAMFAAGNMVMAIGKMPLSAVVVSSIFVAGEAFMVTWLTISAVFISLGSVRKQVQSDLSGKP